MMKCDEANISKHIDIVAIVIQLGRTIFTCFGIIASFLTFILRANTSVTHVVHAKLVQCADGFNLLHLNNIIYKWMIKKNRKILFVCAHYEYGRNGWYKASDMETCGLPQLQIFIAVGKAYYCRYFFNNRQFVHSK